MTMRSCLLLLAVCASLGTAVGVVLAQDSPGFQCPTPDNTAPGNSDKIWAFD